MLQNELRQIYINTEKPNTTQFQEGRDLLQFLLLFLSFQLTTLWESLEQIILV